MEKRFKLSGPMVFALNAVINITVLAPLLQKEGIFTMCFVMLLANIAVVHTLQVFDRYEP